MWDARVWGENVAHLNLTSSQTHSKRECEMNVEKQGKKRNRFLDDCPMRNRTAWHISARLRVFSSACVNITHKIYLRLFLADGLDANNKRFKGRTLICATDVCGLCWRTKFNILLLLFLLFFFIDYLKVETSARVTTKRPARLSFFYLDSEKAGHV